jgi:hypothetical protein
VRWIKIYNAYNLILGDRTQQELVITKLYTVLEVGSEHIVVADLTSTTLSGRDPDSLAITKKQTTSIDVLITNFLDFLTP